MSTETVVDAAHAVHLTDTIGDHDKEMATQLHDAALQLENRQVELRAQRADLERTIESLTPLRELLERRLGRATEAYARVRRGREPRRPARCQHRRRCARSQASSCSPTTSGEPRDLFHVHQGIDMPARRARPWSRWWTAS